ncbi:hypothetical protein GCM10014719_67940 [Planomonospora parontospora subsp. antibiotica]|nr:hypothetical protein GCM10014719_67940 [Planomonospora parontospora subsp. antibiotica]GII15141.1 hypothetical protein Ppa05_18670 [Planomonospora parontospora subsp. antibiotica]
MLSVAAIVVSAVAAPAFDEPQLPTSVLTVADPRIAEASGLSLSGDGKRYYTSGDARGDAEVYVIGERGATHLTLTLPPGSNEDWEDIATFRSSDGRGYIYVADMGDAYFIRRDKGLPARTTFRIVRMDEPSADKEGSQDAAGVVSYPVQYSDKAARNSESLLVQPGTGRVFTLDKTEKPEQRASLWMAPATLEERRVNVMRRVVAHVPVLKASGAAFSPTGDRIVVRNGEKAYVWRVKNDDVAAAFKGKPIEVDLPSQRQGEGITFSADGHALLVNSEGPKQPIWRVPLPKAADTETPVVPLESTGGAESGGGSRDMLMIAIAAGSGLLAIGLITVNVGRIRRARRSGTVPSAVAGNDYRAG